MIFIFVAENNYNNNNNNATIIRWRAVESVLINLRKPYITFFELLHCFFNCILNYPIDWAVFIFDV